VIHFSCVRFKDDGSFVSLGCQVSIQTIPRDIQFAIVEPFIKGWVGVIENPCERFVPGNVLLCEFRPEAGIVMLGFLAQSFIGFPSG